MGKFLIIGGSGGIGSALARRLAKGGHSLHLVGRDPLRLKAVVNETGGTFAAGDVMDAPALDAAVKASGSPLAGLVYAVGSINLKPFSRLSDAEITRDFELNALGAARAVRAALPALSQSPSASILFFSTIAAAQGFAAHASIAMAKGAIEGLTLSLAAEFAPKIRVNCIAPSLTRTPLAEALTASEAIASKIAALHPLQRLGEPEDIAAMAALLLSEEASWITGQVIGIDGGRSTLGSKG